MPTSAIKDGKEKPISADVLAQFRQCLDELGNEKFGHLVDHPGEFARSTADGEHKKKEVERKIREIRNALNDSKEPKPNQLIYVEVDHKAPDQPIVSMGINFRYRWRYTDSIRRIGNPGSANRTNDQERPELTRLEGEGCAEQGGGAAGRLSGARLLFGYAVDHTRDSGNEGLGSGSFERLAGRIAINHAIEVVEKDTWQPERRFVRIAGMSGEGRWLLPLKILGTPKASGVEHYLRQDGIEQSAGATRTYGDLPGILSGESTLNGRKFYRHYPVLLDDGVLADDAACLASADDRDSNQATALRFVSRPGRRFRFTLRFRDLAPWELGALLVALDPALLKNLDAGILSGDIRALLDDLGTDIPGFKLGYARPLGFGTVKTSVSSVLLLNAQAKLKSVESLDSWRTEQARLFLDALQERHVQLRDWLRTLRWWKEGEVEYPIGCGKRDKQGRPNCTIYNYHTGIRRAHSDQRRRPEPLPVSEQPRLDSPVWPDDQPWSNEP